MPAKTETLNFSIGGEHNGFHWVFTCNRPNAFKTSKTSWMLVFWPVNNWSRLHEPPISIDVETDLDLVHEFSTDPIAWRQFAFSELEKAGKIHWSPEHETWQLMGA